MLWVFDPHPYGLIKRETVWGHAEFPGPSADNSQHRIKDPKMVDSSASEALSDGDPLAIVSNARALPAVDALFSEVEKATPIKILQSRQSTWSSKTMNGETTIEVAPTSNPSSALAHELLHA